MFSRPSLASNGNQNDITGKFGNLKTDRQNSYRTDQRNSHFEQ